MWLGAPSASILVMLYDCDFVNAKQVLSELDKCYPGGNSYVVDGTAGKYPQFEGNVATVLFNRF